MVWAMIMLEAPLAHVTIHSSQFPENVRLNLLDSLRQRQINHKFHYDSAKQTNQWLSLHQAYSPSRTDSDCAGIYDRSFESVASRVAAGQIHLIGLGCGGGQKDTRLLRLLRSKDRNVSYFPVDVSTAMVLVARQAALDVIPPDNCHPLVCDLATAKDLPAVLDSFAHKGVNRLLTFFGMMPNFEPEHILPQLAAMVRSKDLLLFSANLAPGLDYATGVRHVFPLYDNPQTKRWLMTFLLDLGVEANDGEMEFAIEEENGRYGLKRIAAHFRFVRGRDIQVEGESFTFRTGDSIRLFFSYRHTPALVRRVLQDHGLKIAEEWIAHSGEEGVFLVEK